VVGADAAQEQQTGAVGGDGAAGGRRRNRCRGASGDGRLMDRGEIRSLTKETQAHEIPYPRGANGGNAVEISYTCRDGKRSHATSSAAKCDECSDREG